MRSAPLGSFHQQYALAIAWKEYIVDGEAAGGVAVPGGVAVAGSDGLVMADLDLDGQLRSLARGGDARPLGPDVPTLALPARSR